MKKYYIPHKLTVGDITNLSDQDSKFAIASRVRIEDIITVESAQGIFLAMVVDISKNNVEIEIQKQLKESTNTNEYILLQAQISTKRFEYVIEKNIEIGVNKILPIESAYSSEGLSKFRKMRPVWDRVCKDALDQSRRQTYFEYLNPVNIKDISAHLTNFDLRICLSTEYVDTKTIEQIQAQVVNAKNIAIAVGPEKGWSKEDLEILKKEGFIFVALKNVLLRAESASSIFLGIIRSIRKEI